MSLTGHTAFFGDGEKIFDLTPEIIIELDRKTGIGFGAFYQRFMAGQFHFIDIIEVLRLGLIGGGMAPAEALALVDAYAKPRPILETFPLALDILEAKWSGRVEPDTTNEDSPA
ncbi:gene transfer agent family protein [Manganibacter manganicus]|uniref:Gene transfer agent family protein n=1 Tax=Manganibacter manganicus TaxID=1873176 RepID=A0A1V8RNE7_9HYPH|nr:gene transfer agent family protein [Pseudaminobacter manganicus]OQM74717.1 hypothetical protein BFN67_03510 [Pseudaminobacter manganicus]